ncbi:hypothetical protein OFQ52_00125 [Brachyspira hyodysenteriae]|uniref:hypothetical protein n=1 Tax=Brachyspira hyodysenteriae TaxID=159 RepID=UPI0022CD9B86|nr:hypothetical protein [Brachyspira hyodysenteriae]MCZ9929185.1 hypothetical protein [Brachyspira hyodysenteriae]MCZ9989330.1 hypothetical protein [Brachyspira hyodysenteriae]MDA0040750.1 hypothetical protein [Brachyspira hyodysenteriae]
MLKKITFIISSIFSLFLLSSCSPAFDRMFHTPRYHPHARNYFDFPILFGPHFGIHSILSIIIKILIIVALVFLVKMLYNKDKNNKKE